MSATFWEVGKYISDKLLIAVLVIAAAFKGVAKLIVVVAAFKGVGKFIADKLLIPILAAALALYGQFLLESYKVSENLRPENYKVSSSIDIYDSNEFMNLHCIFPLVHLYSTFGKESLDRPATFETFRAIRMSSSPSI
jgi:hypothetical protein